MIYDRSQSQYHLNSPKAITQYNYKTVRIFFNRSSLTAFKYDLIYENVSLIYTTGAKRYNPIFIKKKKTQQNLLRAV